MSTHPTLAIATRLHLGHASHPPPSQQLQTTITNFVNLAKSVGATIVIVAVDAEERIEGYSLLGEVERICRHISTTNNTDNNRDNDHDNKSDNGNDTTNPIEIIPVQPWGKFIPALNAIIAHSCRQNAQCLLLVSAEVGIRGNVMERLWNFMELEDTLVVGESFSCSRDVGTKYTILLFVNE